MSELVWTCSLADNILSETIIFLSIIYKHFKLSEKNNVDVGLNISGELDSLKKNLDKYKKSGLADDFEDVDIQTLDWVEDNRKVKAFFIYESSL